MSSRELEYPETQRKPVMGSALQSLLEAAVRAPSGDNLQPWRFVVDPKAGRIALYVDKTRDTSPMNADQRMSRIAVGAALENMLQTAEHNGWDMVLDEPTGSEIAAVRLTKFGQADEEIPAEITARVTNRRHYEGKPISPEVLADLTRRTPELDGIPTYWIADRERIAGLARLIGRADALMFGEPSMRHAFLSNIRYDMPPHAEVDEGLPLGSLEISPVERIGLRCMPRIPDRLLKLFGATKLFAASARRLIESSSGLCLIVEDVDSPKRNLLCGRAAERAWLAMTAQRLAVQPMMSLPVFENVLRHGTDQLLSSLGRRQVESLVTEFHELVPEIGQKHSAFLMRFGWASPPSVRTGRLAPEAVCDPPGTK